MAGPKGVQPVNIQNTRARRLRSSNPIIWHHRRVHHAGGKYSCSSDDDQLIMMTPCQGESEHRRVKRQYRRVHKGRFVRGIATQQHRERQLAQMGEVAPKNTIMSSRTCKDSCFDNIRQDKDKSAPSENDELEALRLCSHKDTILYHQVSDTRFDFPSGSARIKTIPRSR